MASMDSAAIIDYCTLRYGGTKAGDRTRILSWLNQTQREIWAIYPFWFRFQETTFTFTAGTELYTLDAGYAGVQTIMDSTGMPLTHVPTQTFKRVYRNASEVGTPRAWTEEAWDATGKIIRVRIRPIPSSTTNGLIRYEDRVNVLTDSAANYSLIPEEYRGVLAAGVLELMALDEGEANRAQMYSGEKQQIIQAMIADTDRRNKGGM